MIDDALRKRIIAITCDGCRAGWPLDPARNVPTHRHEYTQEAFGSDWHSISWVKCNPDYATSRAIMALVEEVRKETWDLAVQQTIGESTRALIKCFCLHAPGVACINCIEP